MAIGQQNYFILLLSFSHNCSRISFCLTDTCINISGSALPFTLYYSIWSAIPTHLKKYMKDREVTYNARYPENLLVILKDQKGTTSIRKIMNKGASNQSTGLTKWTNELALNCETNWEYIYTMPKKCNVNPRIRFFQFQILHRSLLTNRKLSLFNLIDSEICDNCNMVETVTHLLLECSQIEYLWRGIEGWMHLNINEKVLFNKQSILLGSPENSTIVNYIFLIVKHEIYKSKWNKSKLSLHQIIEKLKYYLKIEEYVNIISIGREKTLGKWSPIYNTIKR